MAFEKYEFVTTCAPYEQFSFEFSFLLTLVRVKNKITETKLNVRENVRL